MLKNQGPKYPAHAAELKRLNRISGQVEGIKKMIVEKRYCPDILMQLRAARSALRSIEANIFETHLQHCVANSLTSGKTKETQEKIEELKELFKRFDES